MDCINWMGWLLGHISLSVAFHLLPSILYINVYGVLGIVFPKKLFLFPVWRTKMHASRTREARYICSSIYFQTHFPSPFNSLGAFVPSQKNKNKDLHRGNMMLLNFLLHLTYSLLNNCTIWTCTHTNMCAPSFVVLCLLLSCFFFVSYYFTNKI